METKDKISVWAGIITLAVFQVEDRVNTELNIYLSDWTGVVGQAFWRVGRSTGLTIRGEVMDDPDGVRTGTAQRLSSVTISPWYFYREAQEGVFSNVEFTSFRLPAFSIRPAVRIDHSDQPVFEKKDGSLVRSNVTALVELVYLF